MTLEEALHAEMIRLYRQAGETVGYWGTRYLQAVRRQGGLARAKEMLRPRTSNQRKGLDALLEAGRPDLTLEAIVLQPRFASLFTLAELAEARARIGHFVSESDAHAKQRSQHLFPDELEPGKTYPEGMRRQVRVNAVERSPAAREACLAHYGRRCAVCDLSFAERYGDLGTGFIHVHHVRPLAATTNGYRVDPVRDLVPVCPNCHAMIHQADPPLEVDELRAQIRDTADARGGSQAAALPEM